MPESDTFVTALVDAQGREDWEAEGRLLYEIDRAEKKYRHSTTPLDRFLTHVRFGAGDCWYWVGSVSRLGYGSCARTFGETKAHRFAYRLFRGDIPDGLEVLHSCDVRNCVNPAHLRVGTHAENMQDMARKGRYNKARLSERISGARNPQAKLTWDAVRAIRYLHATGFMSQREIALTFGVSAMAISRLIRGETWKESA